MSCRNLEFPNCITEERLWVTVCDPFKGKEQKDLGKEQKEEKKLAKK